MKSINKDYTYCNGRDERGAYCHRRGHCARFLANAYDYAETHMWWVLNDTCADCECYENKNEQL